jgi:hypothetical protein
MPRSNGKSVHPAVARIALALPEQRAELRLPIRQLVALSDVSYETIARVEHGRWVSPQLLVRLATALTMVELYGTRPTSAELLRRVEPWEPTLETAKAVEW